MNDARTDAPLPAPGMASEVDLEGPAGNLEALLAAPRGDVRGLAVICHPHPLYGGTMTNKVVYALAATARKCGLLTARFNFRGVGDSAGQFDAGAGETEDTLAVIAWLRHRQPGLPLLLTGFSFGAYVSLRAAEDAKPDWLVSVSVPLARVRGVSGRDAALTLPARPPCPWLAVHSRDDEVVDYQETRQRLLSYQPPPRLETLDGAGHFYHGRLADLQNVVLDFLREQEVGA